ncbi:MAG: hypothetical protein ACOZIN_21965, partial [Myxococcota bacterium]
MALLLVLGMTGCPRSVPYCDSDEECPAVARCDLKRRVCVQLVPDFIPTVSATVVSIKRGQEVALDVEVARTNLSADVQVGLVNAPAGIVAEPVTLSVGASRRVLRITASTSAPLGGPLEALVLFEGGGVTREVPLSMSIVEDIAPNFSLSVNPGQIAVVQGETAYLQIQVERVGGFAEPVVVTVSALPVDVSADPLTLAPSDTTGALVLRAGLTARRTSVARITASAGEVNRQQDVTVTALPLSGSLDYDFGDGGIAVVTVGT